MNDPQRFMRDPRCTNCGERKPAAEFPANQRTRTGLSSWCRDCHREANRKWRRESNYNERRRAERRERRAA